MITNTLVGSFCQNNTITNILQNTLPSESEARLERNASHSSNIIEEYKGETRPWWDLADDDLIYKAISEPLFQDYVKVIELSA